MAKLKLREKPYKKSKGYYLKEETIQFIKDEAVRLSSDADYVSENDVLTAIVDFYLARTKQ